MNLSASLRQRTTLSATIALVALSCAAVPATAAARDCGAKPRKAAPGPVPEKALKLFSLMKDKPTRVSEKRRRMLCAGTGHFGIDPAQARRITSPMGRRGAWFLVPGKTGVLVDTGGSGGATTYAAIEERGWFGYIIPWGASAKYIGAAVDGYDTITGTGTAGDGSPVTFSAPIRHNVFVLATPYVHPASLAITLTKAAAER